MQKRLTFNHLKDAGAVRGRLRHGVIKGRRETVYKMIGKKNGGKVPCFVCGQHVAKEDATLEHVLEQRKGGTDDMDNLSISHADCNHNRSAIERARAHQTQEQK